MFWVPYVRRLLVFPLVPLSQTQKTDENDMKNHDKISDVQIIPYGDVTHPDGLYGFYLFFQCAFCF